MTSAAPDDAGAAEDTARIPTLPAARVDRRPPAEPDVARRDHRGTVQWDLEVARLSNRPTTDAGLVLLRLCSLPLVLHGVHQVGRFFPLVDAVRGNPVGALAPEVFAVLLVAGQLVLPVLLAAGVGTRIAALAQAAMMGSVYAFGVLATSPVLEPGTGLLAGEAVLAYAALALPLVLTGPGRLSVDHALTASLRERRVEKRVVRRLGG